VGRIKLFLFGIKNDSPESKQVNKYTNRLRGNKKLEIMISSKRNYTEDEYFSEISKQKVGCRLVLAHERGTEMDSKQFAEFIKNLEIDTKDTIFAIGPADGFPKNLLDEADDLISLSKMTFPHELAALVLVEQIYRALEILRGTSYHRAGDRG